VDAVHALEVGLGFARDADVVAWCRAQGAIAVTLDANSHALIVLSGQGFQDVRIALPLGARLQPNREWLAERYEIFARAS
jgi:hypothetical protein